ncbi:unnamed protein product [Colias eurytheme]|nr:unnamed protein product [Colias eurytheme]
MHINSSSLIKSLKIADNVQFHKDKDYENQVNQFDADEESQELCDSKHVSFQPQAVKDRSGKWFIVLNSKYKMVQSFNGEVCLGGPKKNCSRIAFFNTSYEGRCVQKYRSASVIVLSNDLKQVIVKATPVPTCCSCVAFKKN